jgi:hypothetical protein
MNIDNLKLKEKDKLDTSVPVYVLINKDFCHFHSLPNGEINWDYNRANMELIEKILEKDFGNKSYIVMPLSEAFPLFCNKQAELVKIWTPAINLIRKEPNIDYRRRIYKSTINSNKVPHPLEADALLKRLLKF